MIETERVTADLVVVGGGLAGLNAAIAAARQGAEVVLVQNRSVLGGNSSSEVRVWVCGATAHGVQHFARETGIMGELFVENQFTNPEGNPYYWDLVLLEAVRAEPRLRLFLNTEVSGVDASPAHPDESEEGYERRINSVTGWQMGSERRYEFSAEAFVDATGDGLIGYLAGAMHRTGREARAELDESWAPEEPDAETLGSTILFYTKDSGHPSSFVAPAFARDISQTSIPDLRGIRVDANGCDYWWIEWGGDRDVVAHNEEIREELQAAVYGIWDYIKNSGQFDAENLTLEWIGSVPGKREYRRFVGDHLLTQHDVLDQTLFADRVAHGGWSIDLHPPGGMYSKERGSRHWHPDGNYHIPLRSLYSVNVANMWMAGRNISASHVAFGTTRVMATCAVVGEAAGTAAAVAVREGSTPRALASGRLQPVHQAMVRADASLLGVEHRDPADHALAAHVSASSTQTIVGCHEPDSTWPLTSSLGLVIPVDPAISELAILIDAAADTDLAVELHDPVLGQNYVPREFIRSSRTPVQRGERQWITVDLPWEPATARNAFVVLEANEAIRIHTAQTAAPGILAFTYREPAPDEQFTEQWRHWKQVLQRSGPCISVQPSGAYAPRKAVGGYARPFGGPQMWVSEPLARDPAPTLELSWPDSVTIGEITVIFDDDLDEDLINLHHHRTPFRVLPTLVRDYRLDANVDGEWREVVEVTHNRRRHRRHPLPAPITVQGLRLVVTATNGDSAARVVSLRAWAAENVE